jgi:hypothetical protein
VIEENARDDADADELSIDGWVAEFDSFLHTVDPDDFSRPR